jgi:DNA-binding GntR family transcriptional regulator
MAPIYPRLAESLEAAIRRRSFRPGDRIPGFATTPGN